MITCFGEMLIDFTPDNRGNFTPNPGGAPANVAVGLSRLKCDAAFCGQIGSDSFGELLRSTLKSESVDVSGLVQSDTAPTSLAFVHLNNGERSFSFYRNGCADTCFASENLNVDLIKSSSIFHFGSLSMTHPISAATTKRALTIAKEAGVLISYDPNLRPALWPSAATARDTILSVMNQADIVKLSDEEVLFLSQRVDIDSALTWLIEEYPEQRFLLTLGGDGALYIYKEERISAVGAKIDVPVDTTGAGDSFVAGFLSAIDGKDLNSNEVIQNALDRAVQVAGRCIMAFGAIPAMPYLRDLD